MRSFNSDLSQFPRLCLASQVVDQRTLNTAQFTFLSEIIFVIYELFLATDIDNIVKLVRSTNVKFLMDMNLQL